MNNHQIDPRRIELLDPAMVEVLRAKTPAERVAMAFEANQTARLLLKAHLSSSRPDWDDRQVEREIASRMLHGAA